MGKESMSPRERLAAFMARQETDRVPILPIHREFSVRQAGYKFLEVWNDPDKYVEAEVRAAREFHFDGVFEYGGPWVEEALGAQMDLFEDEVPAIGTPFLESREQLARLPPFDARRSGRAATILHVVRELRRRIGDDGVVFAWVPQPFRAAGQLRGIQNIFMDMLTEPQLVHDLQSWYLPKLVELADALMEAGADYLSSTNPFANRSCISPKHFEEFVHPYSQRFMALLRERGYKVMYHICGDWSDRLDSVMQEGPAEVLSIDLMDLAETKRRVGQSVSLMGKVRVVETLLQGTADLIRRETRENIWAGASGGGYAMGGNCVIPRDVPRENVVALVEETLRVGRYPLRNELFEEFGEVSDRG